MKLGKVKELISRAPKNNFSHSVKAYHREHLCIWCYWNLPKQSNKTQHFVIKKRKLLKPHFQKLKIFPRKHYIDIFYSVETNTILLEPHFHKIETNFLEKVISIETKRKLVWEVTYKDTEEAFGSRGDGVEGIEVAEFAERSGIVVRESPLTDSACPVA